MRIKETVLYKFDELSPEAQETAIDANRNWNTDVGDWWDGTLNDAKEIGKILGIAIDQIWFSGFYSQGDGACFEGEYKYAKNSCRKIREYAPKDTVLHDIAGRLQAIQRPYFYGLYAYVEHSGHYYHSGCADIDVREDEHDFDALPSDDLAQCLHEFMDWIYFSLELGNEYLTSGEAVRESLIANEIEFLEDGTRY